MAGPGRTPKAPGQRRRVNAVPGARTLQAVQKPPRKPSLPRRQDDPWHDQTKAWWSAVWSSPMSPEFDASDLPGLVRLAALVDAFWRTADDPESGVQKLTILSSEIRLVSQCYGMTPLDRRRLSWEIARGEEAEERTTQRRKPKASPASVKDPRLADTG